MNSIVEAPATMTSTELLEIVNAARKEFGEPEIRNSVFLDRIGDELEGEFYKTFVKPSGESGGRPVTVAELTRDQCMLVAMRESKGVRRKVLAKLKEAEQVQLNPPVSPPALADHLLLAETAARMLNVSESGKLQMLGVAAQRCGINPVGLLPAYAVDAPAGHTAAGSSQPTFSLSELLKRHDAGLSAKKCYLLLQDEGIVERLQRSSSTGIKEFWSVTRRGLEFGKNVTSERNPRETQPHFFADQFPRLLDLIHAAGA